MSAAERQAPDTQTRGLAEDGVPWRRPGGQALPGSPGLLVVETRRTATPPETHQGRQLPHAGPGEGVQQLQGASLRLQDSRARVPGARPRAAGPLGEGLGVPLVT